MVVARFPLKPVFELMGVFVTGNRLCLFCVIAIIVGAGVFQFSTCFSFLLCLRQICAVNATLKQAASCPQHVVKSKQGRQYWEMGHPTRKARTQNAKPNAFK
jgi:hypothetical protein